MHYEVKINEFEGPLDLLLHLIKKSNIDISVIELIENGQDLFLDTPTRQKLAKALKQAIGE